MNLKSIKTGAVSYLVLAFIYVMYSLVTQTGICGWLMDVAFNLFGVAYDKLTAIVAILIVGAPGYMALSYVRRKEQEAAEAGGVPLVDPVPQVQSVRQQLRWMIPLILAPVLISIPVYFYVTWQSRTDQSREVYSVNLNAGGADVPADAKFIQLAGALQSRYEYGVTSGRGAGDSTSRSDSYMPLTGEGWDESQPVRFVMYASGYGGSRIGMLGTQTLDDGTIVGNFDGKLSGYELPTFVRAEYERQGLRLAAPLYIVERSYFVDGKLPPVPDQMYEMIPYFGALISVALAVGCALGLTIRRRRLAKDAG